MRFVGAVPILNHWLKPRLRIAGFMVDAVPAAVTGTIKMTAAVRLSKVFQLMALAGNTREYWRMPWFCVQDLA